MPPCPSFLTPDDTNYLCFYCLGEEHVLEGAECAHCEKFAMKNLRGSDPAVAEARRRLSSWGSQVELVEEFEKVMSLLYSSVTGSNDLLDQDILSLESSDPTNSILLTPSSPEEVDVAEEGEDIVSPPRLPSPHMILLEVMAHATTSTTPCRLDEYFLSGHKRPALMRLQFLLKSSS